MKRLTLVRHAQAESALAGQQDFDRALTRRGAEDAAEMARRLKFRQLGVDCIITSTAPRAIETAAIFARALKIANASVAKDDRLYTAGPNEYLTTLRECSDESTHTMIVAHNPGITDFADRLSSERSIDAMPTCSVVTMRFDVDRWADVEWKTAVDVELDYPGRST